MKRCLAARLTTSTGTKGVFKEKNYLAEYQLINERKVGKRKKKERKRLTPDKASKRWMISSCGCLSEKKIIDCNLGGAPRVKRRYRNKSTDFYSLNPRTRHSLFLTDLTAAKRFLGNAAACLARSYFDAALITAPREYIPTKRKLDGRK